MKPQEIQAFVIKRPFVPFRMRLADGSSHVIEHPELILVSEPIVMVASGIDHAVSGVPKKVAFCDPQHVVSIELLQRNRAKAA